MAEQPMVSVIIPTCNRPEYLRRLLRSLGEQSYPMDHVELIVVDDGSQESYIEVLDDLHALGGVMLHQENQGEAVARNTGVSASQGELLLFLDDDMQVSSSYIAAMVEEHIRFPQAVLIGNMRTALPEREDIFARTSASHAPTMTFGQVPFTSILGGVTACGREVYLALGGMRPVPDRSRGAWIDIDFAFRADKLGYTFRRVEGAAAVHHDRVMSDLRSACQRAEKVAYQAPGLFRIHPELVTRIPMFRDMLPLVWGRDPAWLVARKLLRLISASRCMLGSLEWIVQLLEKCCPSPRLLRPLYRWIQGAYLWRGYRSGLKDLEEAKQE